MKITINPAQQEAQDTFKAGSLVVIKDDSSGIILVTNGNAYTDAHFCGVVLSSRHYSVGSWDADWAKQSFVKFVGSVTLEQ